MSGNLMQLLTSLAMPIVMFGLTKIIDSENTFHQTLCMIAYAFSQGLIVMGLVWIRYRIYTWNEAREMEYIEKDPWAPPPEEEPEEDSKDSKNKNTQTKSNKAKKAAEPQGKKIRCSVAEYDAMWWKKHFQMKFLMPCAITTFMFLKWKFVVPLAIQAIMTPSTHWSFELTKIYLRGFPAKGDLCRPFVEKSASDEMMSRFGLPTDKKTK